MAEALEKLNIQKTYGKRAHDIKSLIAMSTMHFINDLHPTLLPTFLPEIVKRLSLSLGQAGFLNTLFGILNIVVQPYAGHLADKLNRPLLAVWAPALTACGAYLLPISPTYGAALLFVTLMGTGTASFHPQGHGFTGIIAGSENLGAYLAVFSAAGWLGAAVSPLYAVFMLKALGPSLLPFATFLVLAAAYTAYKALPRKFVDAEREKDKKSADGHSEEKFTKRLLRVLVICLPVIVISLIRDSTSQGIRVFLPLFITRERGGSLEFGGAVLFAFTVAGSVSSLIGGRMADIFGKRRVIFLMLGLSPFFLFSAIKLDGVLSLVLFVIGGACIAATSPVTLALAQEYMPESRSTASSIVMGVSWGLANMAASPIGMIADRIGLQRTLGFLSLCPFLVVAAMAVRDASKWMKRRS